MEACGDFHHSAVHACCGACAVNRYRVANANITGDIAIIVKLSLRWIREVIICGRMDRFVMMSDKCAEWRQTDRANRIARRAPRRVGAWSSFLPLWRRRDGGGCLPCLVLQNSLARGKSLAGRLWQSQLLSFEFCNAEWTGLDLKGISRYSSLLSFCSVGHDVASRRRLCGSGLRLAGFTSQSIPKPHIYFKRGAAPNWLPIAP